MTPDELPADMEDLVAFVEQPNTVLLDREVPNLKTSIRALLKAYQEQRRALEAAADSFARIQDYVGGRNIDFASAFARADYGEKRAQAALNQKGNEL